MPFVNNDIDLPAMIETSEIVEMFLPFTKEERKCLQKWMAKDKNRQQLTRILKTFMEDPHGNYRFEKR